MGSLFDGIGGFPLAAIHNGVIPLWASEIEPFPIRVTQQRLPGMLHYGDITKLDGAMLPPVDIICGGSPCQDYAEEIVIPKLLHQGPSILDFPQKHRNNKSVRQTCIMRAQATQPSIKDTGGGLWKRLIWLQPLRKYWNFYLTLSLIHI